MRGLRAPKNRGSSNCEMGTTSREAAIFYRGELQHRMLNRSGRRLNFDNLVNMVDAA